MRRIVGGEDKQFQWKEYIQEGREGMKEEEGKCLWWREWTHEGEGRRANVCGGESGHMRGRGGGQMFVVERVDS